MASLSQAQVDFFLRQKALLFTSFFILPFKTLDIDQSICELSVTYDIQWADRIWLANVADIYCDW